MIIQSGAKILVGGNFTTYDDVTRNHITRINSNGSLDKSFANGNGANENISIISLQQDNKILIGGEFTSYNSTLVNYFARITGN